MYQNYFNCDISFCLQILQTNVWVDLTFLRCRYNSISIISSLSTWKFAKLLFGLIWFFSGVGIVQFQLCSMNPVCGKLLGSAFLLRPVRVVAQLDWSVTNFTICRQLASLSESNWEEPLATCLTYLLENWWWNFMQTSWEYCDAWNYKPLETICCQHAMWRDLSHIYNNLENKILSKYTSPCVTTMDIWK